ncbi:bifunctional lysine-specific demethylase and histidyl-hydroxylase NO66 [Drosophila montana]|uniref:bifunctional lysine-specific demethylase and histidyl-hydroxylase NO66 n=1 Tax=Drosophila montana TaxID=40370 RepID=UPI00313E8C86
MADEVSAYAAYGKSLPKKKAPKRQGKRLPKKTGKQTPKTLARRLTKNTVNRAQKQHKANGQNNGAAVKRENGVQKKPKAKKLGTPDNASAGATRIDSTSGSITNNSNNKSMPSKRNKGRRSDGSDTEQSESLDDTVNMARKMADYLNERGEQNFGSDDDSSGGSYEEYDSSDKDDDMSESGSASESESCSEDYNKSSDDDSDNECGDGDSDSDGDCGSEGSSAWESESGDQFSEEYTLNSHANSSSNNDCSRSSNSNNESSNSNNDCSRSSNNDSSNSNNDSSFSSASSPETSVMPVDSRRKAPKRSEHLSSNADASDFTDSNNNNNNNTKPPAAKLQKLQLQQKLKQKQLEKQEKRASAAAQRENVAPFCPLQRTATNAKSCPLPSKEAAKPGPKSCPLPSRAAQAASKMAPNKMAAKSSALPPKNERAAQQKRDEPQEQQRPKGRRSESQVPLPAATGEPQPEVHLQDSIEEGKRMLHWLINPMTSDDFFSQYWERNACQVKRKQPNYFSQLISFKLIDEMLIRNHLEFTTNIDVTTYKNGVRQTHNPDGRAMPPTVWGFYGDGCSIRILNPSTYLIKVRQLCAMMQEFFHCLVGANVYLTPPNSQGFAPHYDDIEAFVLQVEGRKRWRLYSPLHPSDVLARTSSGNYSQQELGEPLFDAVLEPGDILYFPRGTVHQAVCDQQQHSLHITLSVYQQQAYANLLEELMPAVLQRAIKHHLSLRRGLPLHTWQHLGLAKGDQKSELRDKLLGTTRRLVQQYLMPSDAQIDAAVDQLAKRFQHEALPPVVLPEEHERTVFGSRSQANSHGQCLCDYELTERTSVRLLRANILRLVAEGSSLRVYYYVDNALEFCKYEANFMEIQPTEAAAVEALMSAYPKYLKVAKLPLRSAERRIEVATALWERGLLMTEKPFK